MIFKMNIKSGLRTLILGMFLYLIFSIVLLIFFIVIVSSTGSEELYKFFIIFNVLSLVVAFFYAYKHVLKKEIPATGNTNEPQITRGLRVRKTLEEALIIWFCAEFLLMLGTFTDAEISPARSAENAHLHLYLIIAVVIYIMYKLLERY